MVGESGPRSTLVGESPKLLLGMSTMVGESEEGTGVTGAGIPIRVGESEGAFVPGEELSPLDGVRSAAPPSPASEGFRSGRPREDSSITWSRTKVSEDCSQAVTPGVTGNGKFEMETPGAPTPALFAYPWGRGARELISI